MNAHDYAEIIVAGIALLTFFGTAWNTYQHTKVLLLLAEMRLNMQREMNGKYVRIENLNDLKERVSRLEHVSDEH
jgi:hypothetical protein